MKVLRALSIALLVGVAVASASASQLTFNGTGSNSYEGISSYPYSFTVDGTPNVALMCVSFNEHITGGETWQATKYTVAGYGELINTPLADELAYLYTAAVSDHGKDSSINAAAWFLNEASPANNNANIQDWVLKAEMAPAGSYSGISVYVPVRDGSQSWTDGLPQTFYGGTPTPEPSSLMLLGSGIVGLAGLLRKRFLT